MRKVDKIIAKPEFAHRSLAIPSTDEGEAEIRSRHRPFILEDAVSTDDWVAKLELSTVTEMAQRDLANTGERLKVMVLYGSLRSRYVHIY